MNLFNKSTPSQNKEEEWYKQSSHESQYLYDKIIKYHEYFSSQDKKYRWIVRIFKILLLLLAMASTVVLGLKTVIEINTQVTTGLLLSSSISFLTSISSYFNFEEYWMRNIAVHIRLNVLRDNFIYDAKAGLLDEVKTIEYKNELKEIQLKNIKYWEKAIKRI